MKNLILAIMLVATLVCGATAAVVSVQPGVVRANASGDLVTNASGIRYAAKITGIKVNPATGSKYYRLRKGDASGAIVYETNSAATTSTMVIDAARFSFPSQGLYYQTNDASTNANITIYTE